MTHRHRAVLAPVLCVMLDRLALDQEHDVLTDVGGKIEVERSQEMGGARFTVFVPATTDTQGTMRLS